MELHQNEERWKKSSTASLLLDVYIGPTHQVKTFVRLCLATDKNRINAFDFSFKDENNFLANPLHLLLKDVNYEAWSENLKNNLENQHRVRLAAMRISQSYDDCTN